MSSTELTPISRLSFEELIWHGLWYMAAHPNAPLSSRVMRNRAMCTSLAVVRGKAPCGSVSEIGGVIGLAEEDKAGRVARMAGARLRRRGSEAGGRLQHEGGSGG